MTKGIRLLDKKAFLFIQEKYHVRVRAFEYIYPKGKMIKICENQNKHLCLVEIHSVETSISGITHPELRRKADVLYGSSGLGS